MNKKTIEIALKLRDDLSKGLRASATKATAATNKIAAGAKRVGASFKGAMLSVKGLVAAFLALAALRKVILWMKDSISLAVIQETAINNLNSALIAQGNYTVETSDALQLYARQLQRLVGIGDEVTLGVMATIEGLTGLSGDALPKAMKAVVQISKLYKVDYNAASILLGKTLTSSLNAFSRFGIQIDMTGDSMQRLEGILEGTKAGFIMAEKEVNTFGGTVNILKMAWDDLRESVGFWIGASPGVIAVLKAITTNIVDLDDAISATNKSSEDLAGKGFAEMVTGSLRVIAVLNKTAELFTMVAIGANKLAQGYMTALKWQLEYASVSLANTEWIDASIKTMTSNIEGLYATLVKMESTDIVLTNIIEDINDALINSAGAAVESENAFSALSKTSNDAIPVLGNTASALDAVSDSLNRLSLEFQQAYDKGELMFSSPIYQKYPGYAATSLPTYPAPSESAVKTIKHFGRGGGGTGGQTAGQIGEDYLKSGAGMAAMASSAFSGYQQGGARGAIAGLLPTIGSAFGPWGALAGGILGGIFGKKRRGSTPAEPVYTSDVKLHSSITELLNAVKSGLVMGSGAGINRISNQLKAQALAQGAI